MRIALDNAGVFHRISNRAGVDSLRLASVFLVADFFMAQRSTAARGQDILERWCALAEQRLDHLTELFETGRWRRYHSEVAFLENIQEAKTAVETWRKLATREASLDNSAIDKSWLDRPKAVPPRRQSFTHFPVQESSSSLKRLTDRIEKNNKAMIGIDPLAMIVLPELRRPVVVSSIDAPSAPELPEPAPEFEGVDIAAVDAEAASLDVTEPETAVLDAAPELTLDVAVMQERYPLLRNAL